MNYKSNINLDTVYTSEATEIILGQLVVTENGGRGTIQIIGLDQNDNETILGCASVHQWTDGNTYLPCNSTSVLMHIGDRYKVVVDQTSSSVEGHAYFNHI